MRSFVCPLYPARHIGISLKWKEIFCWSGKWSEWPACYEPNAAWPKKSLPVSHLRVENNPFKQNPLLMKAQRLLDINPVMYRCRKWNCWDLCFSVWAVCSPSQAQVLLHFGTAVWTLGRISNLHIYCPHGADSHSTLPPKGSLIGVVDHTCQLHLHVQVCINGLLLQPFDIYNLLRL